MSDEAHLFGQTVEVLVETVEVTLTAEVVHEPHAVGSGLEHSENLIDDAFGPLHVLQHSLNQHPVETV